MKKNSKTLSEHIASYLRFLSSKKGLLYHPEEPNKPMSKEEQLAALRHKYTGCTECPLGTMGRTQVVFGMGNPDAQLMFIGEGPGRDEDLQGKPFVGRAGKLLTSIITAMELKREDVYISNVVKCRPPQNRTPLPHEAATCSSILLLHEIAIIQPRIICLLGASPTKALLGDDILISKVRGNLFSLNEYKVIPTYHPAYLLRNPAAKKIVWQDMQVILKEIKRL